MAKKPTKDDIDVLTEKLRRTKLEEDELFYGLQGLDPNGVLYRVCRDEENLNNDIVCKGKTREEMTRTVNQHITSGSSKNSQFISATASYDVARRWAFYDEKKQEKKQQRIIKIYLANILGMKAEKLLINLTNEKVAKHFVSGPLQPNWVKSSQEVLFQREIPKKCYCGKVVFEEVTNVQKPPKPK